MVKRKRLLEGRSERLQIRGGFSRCDPPALKHFRRKSSRRGQAALVSVSLVRRAAPARSTSETSQYWPRHAHSTPPRTPLASLPARFFSSHAARVYPSSSFESQNKKKTRPESQLSRSIRNSIEAPRNFLIFPHTFFLRFPQIWWHEAEARMTSIRIADTVHPLHISRSNGDGTSTSFNDGIYNMRDLSRTSSREKRSIKFAEKDAEDDDPGLRQSGDFKTRQVKAKHPRSALDNTSHAV